jgi:hypothetical protein
MAIISNSSPHLQGSDGLPQMGEMDESMAELSARIDRLEKQIQVFPISDVWCDRMIMFGRISAVITAIAGIAYLITVIFHCVVRSSGLVASFMLDRLAIDS